MAFAEVISGDGKQVYRQRIDLADTEGFGTRTLRIPIDLKGRTWVRFEAWDIAANGAFTQPVWLAGESPAPARNDASVGPPTQHPQASSIALIHVIAIVELHAGRREAFLAEFRKVVPLVLAEEGCIEYGPTVDLPTGIPAQHAAAPGRRHDPREMGERRAPRTSPGRAPHGRISARGSRR